MNPKLLLLLLGNEQFQALAYVLLLSRIQEAAKLRNSTIPHTIHLN